jgi:hypothetical protein
MGTFDKVPSTGGKSYYNKQERDWWQQANLPEKLDGDYSEMESTFMERKTPGGVNNTSINLSTLLNLSLCRSYRDPLPSLFSKEVKSKQCSNGCVILRYGT